MAAFRAGHPVQADAANAGYGEVDQLAMVNVAIQLEQLQRHHSLQQALRSGELHLTGLFYDIATAQVLQVTPAGISHLDPLPRAIDNWHPVDAPPGRRCRRGLTRQSARMGPCQLITMS